VGHSKGPASGVHRPTAEGPQAPLRWSLASEACLESTSPHSARIRSKDTSSEACCFEWYSPTATAHIGHQLTGLTVPQDEILGNRALELPYVWRQLMQRALLMYAWLRPVWRCRGGHDHECVIVRHRVHGLHGYPSWEQLSQPVLAAARRLSRHFSRMGFSVARPANFRPGALEYARNGAHSPSRPYTPGSEQSRQ
jgi:hypothetical protein